MLFNKPTLIVLLASSIAVATITGCDKDDDDDNNNRYMLSGDATGAKERPTPVETPGTGTISGTYDADNNTLTYTISWSNLKDSVTMAHFHGPATTEQSAPPVKDIVVTNKGRTASTSGTITNLTEAEEADLLAGKWYYNIHTKAHGPGEIRAQVMTTR